MRKKVKLIDKPSLRIHIDYDHLTVGELGNILIRLQAALRSVAGLSPREYDGRYYREQPRFIASSVSTKDSIDIYTLLSIMSNIASLPETITIWRRRASEFYHRLKVAILYMTYGETESQDIDTDFSGLRIEVTRGRVNLELERQFINEMTDRQKSSIENLIWSFTGPAKNVVIGDEESEITLQWPEEDND